MKKTIFQVPVLNLYRSQKPVGFYDKVKGHTGVDLGFKKGDTLLSPLTFTVVKTAIQNEMGKVIYCRHDATGFIFAFAHNDVFLKGIGDKVMRLEPLCITGNTGSKSTAPHSHLEMITPKPIHEIDKLMTRNLNGFAGYNSDPILFIKSEYEKYGVDPMSATAAPAEPPHNPNGF